MATGIEKIRATLDLIHEKHESLIKGGPQVVLSSTDFKHISRSDLHDVLDVLANDYKCIKFRATPVYKPLTGGETYIEYAYEHDSPLTPADPVLAEAAAIHIYAIDLLDNFDQVLRGLDDEQKAHPLTYNDERAEATYNGITAKLFPTSSIMSTLAECVIKANGTRVSSADIFAELDVQGIDTDKNKSYKTLTNAKDRINGRLEQHFSIQDAISYERGDFWLNEKYVTKTQSNR